MNYSSRPVKVTDEAQIRKLVEQLGCRYQSEKTKRKAALTQWHRMNGTIQRIGMKSSE